MFNRELYLESVLSQLSSKAGEDAYVSTLADVVLHAELDRGHRKAKDNNQDVRSRRKSVEVLTGLRANADRHVLLLGKPGSGKSTALKRLLREDAEKCLLNPELKIPVLLELRRLDTNTSIELLLAKALGVPRYRVKPENIADLLDSDDFLLLFDGLNELPSGTHWLTDWRKEFIHVPMIFSSRELGAETYLGIDVQLRMLPLTEDKARELIKKRLGDNAAAQMLQTLHGRLIALTDTPLLLDMLCSIYLTSQTIPQNQGDLFRKFTQEQYKKHKPSETVKPRHDDFFDFCDDFLQELASFMMSADGDGKNIWLQVSRNQAEKWLERRFKEREIVDASSKTKQWLDDALNLHLLQRATEQGNIEFSHQVFQEYYAAEWLLRYLNDFPSNQICANYLNKIKWTDVFCMLMGLLHDEEQGVKLIDLAFSVDANLAAKLTGATTLHFQEKAFRQLFNKINFFEHKDAFFLLSTNATDFAINYLAGLLKSDDPVVRVRASENLLNVVNPAAFFPLISALQDENEEVRACAASALGNIGDMRAYDALIIALRDDSSEVRSAAAFSLGELGSADAYDSLMLLLNDESPDVRESAIFALGGLGDQRAINDLIEQLHDEDISVRDTAVWALGEIGNPIFVDSMIDVLSDEFSDEVNKTKDNVLRKIGESYIFNVENLISIFQGENSKLKSGIANALCLTKDSESVEIYISLIGHSDSKVREWAAYILSQIANPITTEHLIFALSDKNSEVRFWAAYGLGQIGDQKAIPFLLKIIKDRSIDVRISALNSLGELKATQAIEKITSELKSKNKKIREMAIYALGEIGDINTIHILADVLNDKSASILMEAINALGKIKNIHSFDLLMPLLQCENKDIRIFTMTVLEEFKEEKISTALIEMLKDSDSSVREQAAKSLRVIKSFEAIDALIFAMQDKDTKVCLAAAEALSEMTEPHAIDALIQEFKRKNSKIQHDLVFMLGEINSESTIRTLIENFSGKDANLKESIIYALENNEYYFVIDFLIDLLKSEDFNISNTAAIELSTIDYPYAIDSAVNVLGLINRKIDRQILFGLSKNANLMQVSEILKKVGLTDEYLGCANSIQYRHGYYSYEWLVASDKTNFGLINLGVPLILTEGKTDWKHLEFALNKLQAQGRFSLLVIEFSKILEYAGAAMMLEHCKSLSKTPQNRLTICLFDRDDNNINKFFSAHGNNIFVQLGNNVCIAKTPRLDDKPDQIAIEDYYPDADLQRTDSFGRRFRNIGGEELSSSNQLSKNDFVNFIREEREEFKDVDVSNFAKIFELIETIIAEATKLK